MLSSADGAYQQLAGSAACLGRTLLTALRYNVSSSLLTTSGSLSCHCWDMSGFLAANNPWLQEQGRQSAPLSSICTENAWLSSHVQDERPPAGKVPLNILPMTGQRHGAPFSCWLQLGKSRIHYRGASTMPSCSLADRSAFFFKLLARPGLDLFSQNGFRHCTAWKEAELGLLCTSKANVSIPPSACRPALCNCSPHVQCCP